jgi:integrase
MWMPARNKGKGAEGAWVDLLPPALDALRQYDQAALWGRSWSRSSMHGSWRRAVANTRKALQAEAERTGDRTMLEQFVTSVAPNCYPYDTRHSFLSDVYRQYGDPYVVAAIGQHADLKTTERYTKAAVPEKVAKAIDAMRARWFPEAPKPGATVRDFHVVNK